MRNRGWTILMALGVFAIMIINQSCDSKMNIDEPKRFFKLIGSDGNQAAIDLVTDAQDTIYILGSSTSSSDGAQLYVVKTTAKGIVIWEKIFGDPGDELGKDIELTNSGNLAIVADRTDLVTGEKDFVVYMLNSTDGSIIGTPTLGGAPNVADHASTITEIMDGFIVAAYTDNGAFRSGWVYRYDASMSLVPTWVSDVSQLANGGGGFDFVPVKVIQLSSDLFYTFCYTNSTLGGDDVPDYNFVVYVSGQFNGFKNIVFIPGLAVNSDERLTSVRAVPTQSGGGFVLGGYVSTPNSNEQNLYLVRIRKDIESAVDPASFVQELPKAITDDLSSVTTSNATVYPSKNSGFLVLGDQNSTGNYNIFLTKVGNSFTDAWDAPKTFGGEGNDTSGAVAETSDGRILLCGTMVMGSAIGQTKVVLINLDPIGKFDE